MVLAAMTERRVLCIGRRSHSPWCCCLGWPLSQPRLAGRCRNRHHRHAARPETLVTTLDCADEVPYIPLDASQPSLSEHFNNHDITILNPSNSTGTFILGFVGTTSTG